MDIAYSLGILVTAEVTMEMLFPPLLSQDFNIFQQTQIYLVHVHETLHIMPPDVYWK